MFHSTTTSYNHCGKINASLSVWEVLCRPPPTSSVWYYSQTRTGPEQARRDPESLLLIHPQWPHVNFAYFPGKKTFFCQFGWYFFPINGVLLYCFYCHNLWVPSQRYHGGGGGGGGGRQWTREEVGAVTTAHFTIIRRLVLLNPAHFFLFLRVRFWRSFFLHVSPAPSPPFFLPAFWQIPILYLAEFFLTAGLPFWPSLAKWE